MATYELWDWPALQAAERPQRLQYERGVWGKPHGTGYGFRWIAHSEGFLRDDRVAWALPLGNEDDPRRMCFWRWLPAEEGGADRHFAGVAYRSQAQDAAGRSGFLEKQIAEWTNRQGRPAALGAFGLLPMMDAWDDAVWWGRRDEADWSQPDSALAIADCQPIDPYIMLAEAVGQGLAALFQAVAEDALAGFYMRLLAGESPACLYAAGPLSPLALAALLLPLPRETADRLSLAGWIPSFNYAPQEFAGVWDVLVLPAGMAEPRLSERAESYRDKAGKMTQALRENNPRRLRDGQEPLAPIGKEKADATAIALAIWGVEATGKTVLMTQLQLDSQSGQGDWNIYSNHGTDYINGMKAKRLANEFPSATPVAQIQQITYEFVHKKTQAKATLQIEDRSGEGYRTHKEEALQRIHAAAGLVLLIDLSRARVDTEMELTRLFDQLRLDRLGQADRRPKDPRPIAVCVSKADELIETVADYRRACAEPDAFVRDKDDWGLASLLEQYCANFRFFPISAAGVELRHGEIEHNTFYDENLTLRIKSKGRSFNLMAPFDWLIGQLATHR